MQLSANMGIVELALQELLRVNHYYVAVSEAKREWPESLTAAAERVASELLARPINWVTLREAIIAANMQRGYVIEGFSSTAYAAQQAILDPSRHSLRETVERLERKRDMARATVQDRSGTNQIRDRFNTEEVRFVVAQYIRHEQLPEAE